MGKIFLLILLFISVAATGQNDISNLVSKISDILNKYSLSESYHSKIIKLEYIKEFNSIRFYEKTDGGYTKIYSDVFIGDITEVVQYNNKIQTSYIDKNRIYLYCVDKKSCFHKVYINSQKQEESNFSSINFIIKNDGTDKINEIADLFNTLIKNYNNATYSNNESKQISLKSNKTTNNKSKIIDKTDVDINIPVNNSLSTKTYALIIGNEDYTSFQPDLSSEVNVDFAINDAKIFKAYCNKTFGIPEKQIKLLSNATLGQMNQGIAWLNNLANVDNGNAELIFYYSGHGLPDDKTKESYLIPVDISGSDVTQGIKLSDLYNKLNAYPTKKVIVFLDACFSGGARNQGLIAMKGVKIKPKENMVTGNMIVISSSTGEESSGVYRDKQHGFMTYFLLKKLQESKGNISYKELVDFIIENVKKETALIGKTQTPQLNYSPNIEKSWTNWKIK